MQTPQNNITAFEPSVEAIRDEMRAQSIAFDDARESLIHKAKAKAARISALIPESASKLQAAQSAADEAARIAAELNENNEAVLFQAESALCQLGDLKLKIHGAKSLLFAPGEKVEFQNYLIGLHADSLFNPQPTSAAQIAANCQNFVLKEITQNQIAAFVKPLEQTAAKLVSEIKQLAAREKINLASLVKFLTDGQTTQAKFNQYKAADSFTDLL